jgi:hypothetical protein
MLPWPSVFHSRWPEYKWQKESDLDTQSLCSQLLVRLLWLACLPVEHSRRQSAFVGSGGAQWSQSETPLMLHQPWPLSLPLGAGKQNQVKYTGKDLPSWSLHSQGVSQNNRWKLAREGEWVTVERDKVLFISPELLWNILWWLKQGGEATVNFALLMEWVYLMLDLRPQTLLKNKSHTRGCSQ